VQDAVGSVLANRGWVAGQFIGDHDARFIADAVNNLPQEAFGRLLIRRD
jgi:hypothetical protein